MNPPQLQQQPADDPPCDNFNQDGRTDCRVSSAADQEHICPHLVIAVAPSPLLPVWLLFSLLLRLKESKFCSHPPPVRGFTAPVIAGRGKKKKDREKKQIMPDLNADS